MLAKSLLKRMRLDLTSLITDDDTMTRSEEESDTGTVQDDSIVSPQKWVALPRTLRLSTRPRPPLNLDGSRSRTFTRISKSGNMPSFVSNLALSIESLAKRLVEEALMPLFRKLHPEKSGWNLSLVNICATNMSLAASDGANGAGRDIGKMFSRQVDVLKEWKVDDIDVAPSDDGKEDHLADDVDQKRHNRVYGAYLDSSLVGSEDIRQLTQESIDDDNPWDNEEDTHGLGDTCSICGAVMPSYAVVAHERFHASPD